MSDIEKKIEALKAEFLEKLEVLEKEAAMQKKQEEPKPWKPETREKYFCVDNYFLSHSFYNMNDDVDSYNFEISNYFRTRERAEQQRKCGCCCGWNNCMTSFVRTMSRIGKKKKISFVSATTMRESNGAWKVGFFLKVKDLCGLILLRTPKKQRKS